MTSQDEKLVATSRSAATLHQLLAAVETMQLGVTIADASGTILYANPAQARMYGVDTPDEIIGKDVAIFCLPGYRDPLTPKHLRDMTSWRRESVNVRKDGSVLPVLLLSDLVRGPDGESMGVITTCEDLTEAKGTETEWNRLRLQVQHTNLLENLGALTSGLAQDLKDMVAVVLANTEPFLDDLPLDSDVVHRRIVEVDAAVNSMATQIDQLLEDSEWVLGATLPLRLNDHVRAMLPLFEASVDRNVRFRYELGEGLPSIEADPAQVSHAVRQLIANASEAFEGRAGEIVVRTTARDVEAEALDECQVCCDAEPGLHVLLEVNDDGPGMDPKTAARIFDPFFGAQSSSKGLGLAATAAIMRRHHGAIWVSSRSGEGTCMRLLFPVTRRTPRAEAAAPTAATLVAAFSPTAMPVPAPVPVPSEPTRSVRSRVVPDLARALRWLPLSFGKQCPRCGGAAPRTPTVWYARPVRLLLRRYSSTRMCVPCDWKGLTLHRG